MGMNKSGRKRERDKNGRSVLARGMKRLNLYTTDSGIIKERVCRDNLENIYEGV